MLNLTLKNSWKRLCELGQAPQRSSSSRHSSSGSRSYRTGFQRAIGAIFFMFIYLAMASQSLAGDTSSGNTGILSLLFYSAVAAGVGAFFAPRMAALFFSLTLTGRRARADKRVSSSASSKSKNATRSQSKSSSRRADS